MGLRTTAEVATIARLFPNATDVLIGSDGVDILNQPASGTTQLSFAQLIRDFMLSRGGWMFGSVVFAVALRAILDNYSKPDFYIALGVLVAWPILEWFFHRFLMHEWTFLPFHFTHDRHHKIPNTDTGLPDGWVIGMYFVLALVLWLFSFKYMLTAGSAVLVMLMLYEFVHFSCHCNYRPLTWWGWAVRVNHLQHHASKPDQQHAMLFPIVKNHR